MQLGRARRRGTAATLVAGLTALSISFVGLSAGNVSAAPAPAGERATTISNDLVEIEPAKIKGTWTDGDLSGQLNAKFMPTDFEAVDGALTVTGTVTGVLSGKLPEGVDRHFNETGVTATVADASASSSEMTTAAFQTAGYQAAGVVPTSSHGCDILSLDLQGLDLDVLGLVVDLEPVVLDIVAQPGAGNLLGNLLCAVAGLLDPGSGLGDLLDGLLAGVADALDGLLGGLLDLAVITDLVQQITDALGGLTGAAQTQSA